MKAVSTVHYLNLAFKYLETKKQFRSVEPLLTGLF
jgi:hypothetical protein